MGSREEENRFWTTRLHKEMTNADSLMSSRLYVDFMCMIFCSPQNTYVEGNLQMKKLRLSEAGQVAPGKWQALLTAMLTPAALRWWNSPPGAVTKYSLGPIMFGKYRPHTTSASQRLGEALDKDVHVALCSPGLPRFYTGWGRGLHCPAQAAPEPQSEKQRAGLPTALRALCWHLGSLAALCQLRSEVGGKFGGRASRADQETRGRSCKHRQVVAGGRRVGPAASQQGDQPQPA